MFKDEYNEICYVIDSYTEKDNISNLGSFLDKLALTCKLFKSPRKYADYMRIIFLIYSRHYNCFSDEIERLLDLKKEIEEDCVEEEINF